MEEKILEFENKCKKYLNELNNNKDNILEYILSQKNSNFGNLVFNFAFYQSHFRKFLDKMTEATNMGDTKQLMEYIDTTKDLTSYYNLLDTYQNLPLLPKEGIEELRKMFMAITKLTFNYDISFEDTIAGSITPTNIINRINNTMLKLKKCSIFDRKKKRELKQQLITEKENLEEFNSIKKELLLYRDKYKYYLDIYYKLFLNSSLNKKDLHFSQKISNFQIFCERNQKIKNIRDKINNDLYNMVLIYINIFNRDYLKKDSLLDIIKDIRKQFITIDCNEELLKDFTSYRTIEVSCPGSPFTTANVKDIETEMNNLEELYQNNKNKSLEEYISTLVEIFQRFIKIHPYLDANGRTSRVLISTLLLKRNLIPVNLYDNLEEKKTFLDYSNDNYINGSSSLRDYFYDKVLKANETDLKKER